MIKDDKINANFVQWVEKLKKYGCYSERLIQDLGEQIKNASFALNANGGAAYRGSMIDVVLHHLCKIAYHINEDAFGIDTNQKYKHQFIKVNTNMLMRVLLLQHIAKAEMFIPQKQEWKIKNGYPYDFNDEMISPLKCGERSLFICLKYGIQLAEEEYEAIRIIDKEEEFKNSSFINPLCLIVKMVNYLASIEMYRMNNKIKNS